MRDMNFFSVYADERRKAYSKWYGTLLLLSVAVVVFGGIFTFLQFMIGNVNGQIDSLQAQMNDPKTASKFQQAQDKQQYLNNLSDYSGMLNQIADAFKNVGGISSANIEKIAGSAAGDAVFTNLSVNESQMSLSGTASRMEMVSSVAANLMNTQLFSEVSVSSVNYTGGRYEFQMGCKLKGGSAQ